MISSAREKTFGEYGDAVKSDLLAAELEDAIKRLMDMVSEQMRFVPTSLGKLG
jgi:hypothetical protein